MKYTTQSIKMRTFETDVSYVICGTVSETGISKTVKK